LVYPSGQLSAVQPVLFGVPLASVLGLLYCTASLHSRIGPRCRPSWPQPAPVCRWYAPGVRQHFGQGCWATAAAVGRFRCMSRRHRGLAKG